MPLHLGHTSSLGRLAHTDSTTVMLFTPQR